MKIYNVYLSNARDLYANIVETSCNGDLHFDIVIDYDEVKLSSLNRKNLLDYMFSHMEKGDLLSDIDSYAYKGYIYSN